MQSGELVLAGNGNFIHALVLLMGKLRPGEAEDSVGQSKAGGEGLRARNSGSVGVWP